MREVISLEVSKQKKVTEGNIKAQNVKNLNGKITSGIAANCFTNA